jgi:hypothetical protein
MQVSIDSHGNQRSVNDDGGEGLHKVLSSGVSSKHPKFCKGPRATIADENHASADGFIEVPDDSVLA